MFAQPVVGGSGEKRLETQDYQKSYFKKKICIKFLPSRMGLKEFEDIQHLSSEHKRENIRCKCGLPYKDHGQEAENDRYEPVEDLLESRISVEEFSRRVYVHPEDKNNERLRRGYKNTIIEADGAEMGVIEFQMGVNATSKSKFTRLSDGTGEGDLKLFLKNNWQMLEAEPELLISIIGTTTNKTLADKLVESILKISRFVSLIILTSGLESDIMAKKIGDAVKKAQRYTTEKGTQSKTKIKCVGITTWGSLKEKPAKVYKNLYCFKTNASSRGRSFLLNPGHSFFLLVDDGTTWESIGKHNEVWAKLQRELKGTRLDKNVYNEELM